MRLPRLAIATAFLLMIAGCGSSGRSTAQPSTTHGQLATKVPAPKAPVTTAPSAGPDIQPQPAVSPRAAVESFLSAEIGGDALASYNVLSSADRGTVGGSGGWAGQHTAMPRYLTYSVTSVTGPTVVTEVTMQPRVDETAGVVPAAARVTWTTIGEAGGWTVSFTRAKFEAHDPDPAKAASAALAWATAAAHGESASQYDGNLLGQPDVVDRLKTTPGSFTAAPPATLASQPVATAVTDTFGPDAVLWARLVHLAGPVDLDVVTAPLGDRWVVVAAAAT